MTETLAYTTWDEAKEAFADAEEAAIRDWTCFCKCGCRAPDVAPRTKLGLIAPGLCSKCQKKGLPRHEASTPASVWNDMEDEAIVQSGPHIEQAPRSEERPSFVQQVVRAFMEGFRKGYAGEDKEGTKQ